MAQCHQNNSRLKYMTDGSLQNCLAQFAETLGEFHDPIKGEWDGVTDGFGALIVN
jgi:hypothetical protein